jgi:hypothetical protein
MADADLIGGDANKVAILVMQCNGLQVLIASENMHNLPKPRD